MKIIKFLFFFIIILLIVGIIAIYNLKQNYNISKIINELENIHNAKITLKEKPQWVFIPKIKLNIKSKLENNFKNYSAEQLDITFTQSYKFSPLNFQVNTDSFFIKNLELKSLNALGNYKLNDKKVTLESIKGNIGDGNFLLKGFLNILDSQKIMLQGNLKNIHLNQILRQLDLANWQRIEIKLSSNNFILSSNRNSFLQNVSGLLPISGSMYFVITEEEKFGIAFLRLLIEQMPNFNDLSKSLSQIIEGFGGTPALIKGDLKIKNGIIKTDNLNVKNDNKRIDIKGSYDMISDLFDTKILFFDSNKLIVEVAVLGNVENPSIHIVNNNITQKNNKNNNDLKKVFNEGIQSLIDKLLGTSE